MDENQRFTEQQVVEAINSSYGMGVMDTLMGIARHAEPELRKNLIAKMGAVIVKSDELGTVLSPNVMEAFTEEFFEEYVQHSINLN